VIVRLMIMSLRLSMSQHGRALVDLSQDLPAEQHHSYPLAATAFLGSVNWLILNPFNTGPLSYQ